METEYIYICENGIHLVFFIDEDRKVKFLHCGKEPFQEGTLSKEEMRGFRLVEIEIVGLDRPEERHGTKYIVTAPGYRLIYDSKKDYRNLWGRKIEFVTKDEETGIYVTSHFQFYNHAEVIKTWQVVENRGTEKQIVTYLSTFVLNGIEKEGVLRTDDKLNIGILHNSWQRELQWRFYDLPELGCNQVQEGERIRSSKTVSVTNTGNWSSKEYIPMGSVINTETGKTYLWQIEHNGSWHWEISDQTGHMYLQFSGPTENESHWCKELLPGHCFTSVSGAITVQYGFENAVAQLTKYRRIIRRENQDNIRLGVIFNDYMNCLWAEPTTEKELPLIEAAKEVGCEYYCIDAGWYSSGYWWDNVGEWQPSMERFPQGMKELTDKIRDSGMIPGLWLEIEVMGIHCKLVKEVTPDWFFIRHGKPVYDRSRFQLDFRNPQVRAYADQVIERLVKEYGIGYIKMDYNIEPGIGTELKADSPGDGLLNHERAYLEWLDHIFIKYPELIIENCSSGGLRMDYGMLQRHSIQSTSDQEDYRHYAAIAVNAPTALTPEQAAVWSYPLKNMDCEETIFNMVNAMLLRIHQSGNLSELSSERKALVKEGIACYKSIRNTLRKSTAFWPIGLANFGDPWMCLGMRCEGKAYVAVWKCNTTQDTILLPMEELLGRDVSVKKLYPQTDDSLEVWKWNWNKEQGTLSVHATGQYTARLFVIEVERGQYE